MADDLNGKPAWFIALEITVPAGLGMAVVPWQAGDFASTSLAVALLQTGGIVLMFTAVFFLLHARSLPYKDKESVAQVTIELT